MKKWPLYLIAVSAGVAVWSGWVGLGTLCGFGMIHPLPGIIPGFRLNTAICLPVGVEAYGAYSLRAWLVSGVSAAARTFAKRSAIGALLLGMAAQVVLHLLEAAGYTRAPWPVVVAVSCMPVITLGFAAALAHLLSVPAAYPDTGTDTAAGTDRVRSEYAETRAERLTIESERLAAASVPAAVPAVPGAGTPDTEAGTRADDGDPDLDYELAEMIDSDAEVKPFRDQVERGETPGIRQIRDALACGQPKAQRVQARLEAMIAARP